jgi:hypothetical protein
MVKRYRLTSKNYAAIILLANITYKAMSIKNCRNFWGNLFGKLALTAIRKRKNQSRSDRHAQVIESKVKIIISL